MAQKSVLQYVQSCLSSMDSDLVDAISDTQESMQVAELLKDLYYELINREEWKFLDQAIQLVSAGDTTSPTKFTIPTSVKFIKWLAYNADTDSGEVTYKELIYLEPEEFLLRFAHLSDTADRVLVTVNSKIQFYIETNRMPEYWTSFDDVLVFCDAHSSATETTLTSARLQGWGTIIPDFTVSDTFVPNLPEHMNPLLQHTLNSVANLQLKQQASPADEARVLRQMAQARRAHSKTGRKHYFNNQFGRR